MAFGASFLAGRMLTVLPKQNPQAGERLGVSALNIKGRSSALGCRGDGVYARARLTLAARLRVLPLLFGAIPVGTLVCGDLRLPGAIHAMANNLAGTTRRKPNLASEQPSFQAKSFALGSLCASRHRTLGHFGHKSAGIKTGPKVLMYHS